MSQETRLTLRETHVRCNILQEMRHISQEGGNLLCVILNGIIHQYEYSHF